MLELPVVASFTLEVTRPVELIAIGSARVPETIGAWVSPEFTVCGSPGEVLPLKLRSPAYVAVSVLAPGEVKVREQLPAATVPVQLTVPSLTVTFRSGGAAAEVEVAGVCGRQRLGAGRGEGERAAPRGHRAGAAHRPVAHRDVPGGGAGARGGDRHRVLDRHRLAHQRRIGVI